MMPVATSVNAFGGALLTEWRQTHVNDSLLFSPLSVMLSFVLLYHGARGKTRQEFNGVFDFATSGVFDAFLAKSIDVDGAATLLNRVYVDETVRLTWDFAFAADVTNIKYADFLDDAKAAREAINAWVSDATERAVSDLVPRRRLGKKTRVVAVSAVAFDGAWQHPFPSYNTRYDVFLGVEGPQRVPFMTLFDAVLPVRRLEGLDATLVGLPYNDERYVLYVLLPRETEGWRTAEARLHEVLDDLFVEDVEQTLVKELTIPKFEMDFRFDDDLTREIQNVGLMTAFSTDDAEFSGMTADREALSVSDVFHGANIRVDETDTDPLLVTRGEIHIEYESSITIRLAQPFLYFIVDVTDQSVLLQGTLTSVPVAPPPRT